MSSFFADRLVVIEAQIVAYETAITALLTEGIQSYTLDTGQTKQTVTKFDLDKLRAAVDGLYNQYTVMRARCGLDGTVTVGAAW